MTALDVEALVEAWRTNHRITLLVLEQVAAAGFQNTLSKRGGRDVSRQFAHLHNVRTWQLQKRAAKLGKELSVFATADHPTRAQLRRALDASADAVEAFLRAIVAGAPGARCMKRGPIQMLAYFVAHESHHRGSILLTLKQCGHAVDKATRDGIWDWDRR
ncbi:MAG: DinB family protein [Planctomycetota bacterium]